jgi:hypothetical protein
VLLRRDNAVAESFFASLKKERVKKRIYKNRELATETCPTTSNRSRIASDATSTSEGSVSKRSKPVQSTRNSVSTESWELQQDLEDIRALMREQPEVVCTDVLGKYKHEVEGGLSFRESGVDEEMCRNPERHRFDH